MRLRDERLGALNLFVYQTCGLAAADRSLRCESLGCRETWARGGEGAAVPARGGETAAGVPRPAPLRLRQPR